MRSRECYSRACVSGTSQRGDELVYHRLTRANPARGYIVDSLVVVFPRGYTAVGTGEAVCRPRFQ